MAVIVTDAEVHVSPGRIRRGVLQTSGGVITDQDVPVDGSTVPVSATAIRTMLIVDPADLVALVIHGRLVVRRGTPVRAPGADGLHRDDPRLGAWTDRRQDMTQELTRAGRYTETRQGRADAFTGSFWLDADRITYLDDTGFWAFGQYHHGVLHHAGFVLRR